MGGIKKKQHKTKKQKKIQIQNGNVKFSLFPRSISDRIPFSMNCNNKAKIKTQVFFLFCYYSSLVFAKTARFRYCHKYKSLYNFQNCHAWFLSEDI